MERHFRLSRDRTRTSHQRLFSEPADVLPDVLVTRRRMASFIIRGLFNKTSDYGSNCAAFDGREPNAMPATTGAQSRRRLPGLIQPSKRAML